MQRLREDNAIETAGRDLGRVGKDRGMNAYALLADHR
jgi:hypothetical protein